MSMQTHLVELEKKHQALEAELNDCLSHPGGFQHSCTTAAVRSEHDGLHNTLWPTGSCASH